MNIKLALIISSVFALSACTEPHPVDAVESIGPSETAFLVALQGDTLKNQSKMKSVDFLENSKVQAKLITIPHKILDLCPTCNGQSDGRYKDVPTAVLYKVSRAPVSRVWTSSTSTGTSAANQAFSVESSESVDFDIGATIIAHISEENTAKFLYLYKGDQLTAVIDTVVRTYISGVVSKEFGLHTYDWARANKSAVFEIALKSASEFFAPQGISIDSLSFTDGITPHDPAIQKAINAKYVADQSVGIAEETLIAANKLAQAKDAVAAQQTLENRRKELDLQAAAIAKWDGHMPASVVSSGGSLIFGINTK